MNKATAIVTGVVAALIVAVLLLELSRSAESYTGSSLKGQFGSGLGNAPARPPQDGALGAGPVQSMLAKAVNTEETLSYVEQNPKNSTLSGVFTDGEGIEPPGAPV